ncbi:hypothetical protein GGI15_000476 [Coemansia interrupta]|uniref:Sld7 C-terminal domain-containing protein n=1 Tax=Coemansia interrupta TaxID=1126814 RepID=A0A9W8LMD1_9FUNG|nr:hypothetical protein GGI15_000476 [Coemansia interrupta]
MLGESAEAAADATARQTCVRRLHLEYGDQRLAATAILRSTQPPIHTPGDAGRLRILRRTALRTVPAAFFHPTHFTLHVSAATHAAQRHVNGLLHPLVPPPGHEGATGTLAYLAHVDLTSDPAADPFAAAPEGFPGGRSFALLYAGRRSAEDAWHVVVHVLVTPRQLEPLGHIPGGVRGPEMETRFLELLAGRRGERMRMQRTVSTENIMRAGDLGRQRRASNMGAAVPGRRLHRGRMTLTDIEMMMRQQTLAGSQPAAAADPAEAPVPDASVEQRNKRVAKQLIISSLKERGIGRSHQDFAALWSQIYRSLRFALRDKLGLREYAPRELKAESDKHAAFYCSTI